ncbi:unnamed protein product [Coffea canephora]|uniref:Disease resistance R13L4/SHOC-2-like LRR domain-containing protein n=1 Tax=Coffea canephora TaxID=49390 RepID=A0A068UZ55_COFCA|nr:unnamed protein product [Coffea canephora]
MHDLVNDLARFVFGKLCVILFINLISRRSKDIRTFLPLRMDQDLDRTCFLSNKFLEDTLPQFMALRVLSLSYYENIVKLPNSCSGLKQLRFLDLSSTKIKELLKWICSFYNLQTLLLSKCKELEELQANLGKLINLCCLDISETPLKKMLPQMGILINLRVLTAFVISKDNGLTIKELGKLPMLRGKLFLSGLENISSGMDASLANMEGKKNLEKLTLKWHIPEGEVFNRLEEFNIIDYPKLIGKLPQQLSLLQSFEISNCSNLVTLPLRLNQFSRLEKLTIDDCESLLPLHVSRLPASLKSLECYNYNLELESESSEEDGTLDYLRLENCDSLKVERLASFPKLKGLSIIDCKSIEVLSIPAASGIVRGLPSSLQSLKILRCKKLTSRWKEWGLEKLPYLTDLWISLQNLKVLNYSGLRHLTSIQHLVIGFCHRLQYLPEKGLPASLTTLDISDCPMLKPRLEWDKGQDWPKIAPIPCLVIDDELVP